MKLLRDNRSSLVTTSQTMDELSRNRRKIIEELKENLKQAKPQKNILPFTRILDSSDKQPYYYNKFIDIYFLYIFLAF